MTSKLLGTHLAGRGEGQRRAWDVVYASADGGVSPHHPEDFAYSNRGIGGIKVLPLRLTRCILAQAGHRSEM